MREIGAPVARRYGVKSHTGPLERRGLEPRNLFRGRHFVGSQLVPCLIEQRGGQILGSLESLVEGLGREDLVEQIRRHRFTGLVMQSVVFQDLRPGGPHLVDLRRVFHEVAWHRCAGEVGVAHVRKETVQRVPELMEHRYDLVKGQQGGVPFGRFRYVQVVGDHRRRTQQVRLRHVRVHPGAALLGRPRVIVADKQPERRPVGVEDFPDTNIRVIDRKLRPFLEGQAEQTGRRKKHAVLDHVSHLEVRAQLRRVERVAVRPNLLGVVRPVPGRQCPTDPVRSGHRLEIARLPPGIGRGRRRQAGEPRIHGIDRLRGLLLQDVRCMVRIPEHRGAFRPQPGNRSNHPTVVECTVLAASRQRRPHDAFPKRPVGQ